MAKGKGRGGMPSKQNMMAQLQRMQEQMEQAQRSLAEETVEVSAGGGAVRIVMTGAQECKAVKLDPALVGDGDAEMLQDLILVAVNQAVQESQEMAAAKLGPLAGAGAGMLGLG